jgi:hypothetical protein
MHPQQGVRRDNGGDRSQPLAPEAVCPHGQPAPVVLAQLQASAPQLTTEDPILLKEITKDVAFLAIQPSDENGEHQLKGRDINYGPESISRCDGFVVCYRRSNDGTLRAQLRDSWRKGCVL